MAANPVPPRGELSTGLGLKAGRKRLFLSVSRTAGLYNDVHWHACSRPESDQVQRFFSPEKSRTFLASNLPEPGEGGAQRHTTKQPGKLRIVLAARIAPMKNTIAAIRIAGKLPGAVELDLWGPLEDKAYWDSCQQQIALSPPNLIVRYRGEVEHEKLHDLLQNYDVMLMPTLGENFGHAIIEALDAGLPVVISDRTPWRDLERHGIGADLPLDDEAAFLRALAKYQSMDENGMAVVRDACRRYVDVWRANNAHLDDYRKMFDAVIASKVSHSTTLSKNEGLIISQYFYPENFRVNDLAAWLADRGHDVTALLAFRTIRQADTSRLWNLPATFRNMERCNRRPCPAGNAWWWRGDTACAQLHVFCFHGEFVWSAALEQGM